MDCRRVFVLECQILEGATETAGERSATCDRGAVRRDTDRPRWLWSLLNEKFVFSLFFKCCTYRLFLFLFLKLRQPFAVEFV